MIYAVLLSNSIACTACLGRSGPERTLLDWVRDADAAVIGMPVPGRPKAYKVSSVLAGEEVAQEDTVELERFGKPLSQLGLPLSALLVFDDKQDRWLKAAGLTLTQERFLKRALKAPSDKDLVSHGRRLKFFHPYLDHLDPAIAKVAYQEWARAPYQVIRGSRTSLEREKVISRMKAQPKPLDDVLLGLCGNPDDLELIRQQLPKADANRLPALLTAYLEMTKQDGLAWILEHYLKNEDRSADEVAAAITAIGVHGEAVTAITRKEAIAAFRIGLAHHPKSAGTMATWLTKWKVWSLKKNFELLVRQGIDHPDIKIYLEAAAR